MFPTLVGRRLDDMAEIAALLLGNLDVHQVRLQLDIIRHRKLEILEQLDRL
jgi:hypothetical protein